MNPSIQRKIQQFKKSANHSILSTSNYSPTSSEDSPGKVIRSKKVAYVFMAELERAVKRYR